MISIHQLEEADFARLQEIDVSEHITLVYRLVTGELVTEPHDWRRPRWDAAAWRDQVAEWRQTLKPDVWLGAFAGGQMAGEASVRFRLSEATAQLTTLHVDRAFRRRGVARGLVREVITRSVESGATALYVSATPSESAVGFYLSERFLPTDSPDPALFALEPEDIHMVRRLP